MAVFSVRYRIRFSPEEGKYIPESKATFLFFKGRWQPYHQIYPCDDELLMFEDIQEAITFLEAETGQARRLLDIQYLGI